MTPSSARGSSAAAFPASISAPLLVSTLVLLLGLTACDQPTAPTPAETAAENPRAAATAPGTEAAPHTASATVADASSPGAPSAIAPSAVAEGTPVFAVLYPGARIEDTPGVSAGGPAGPGGLVTFVTDDAPDAVVSFYRERAEASGLTSTMAMNQGEARAYGAARGAEDGASVQVVASPDGEGRTSVQLAWSRGR